MLRKPKKLWNSEYWASWKPFGLGEQYPNNYWEVFRAAWVNKDQFSYAWDILNNGVCDGCSLGTTGMKDLFLIPHPRNVTRGAFLRCYKARKTV